MLGVSRRSIIRWEKGECLPWGAKHGHSQKATRRRFFRLLDKLEAFDGNR